VDLAVGPDRRAGAGLAVLDCPDGSPLLGVEAEHLAAFIAHIEPVLVEDRRGEFDGDAVPLPDQFRLLLLDLGGVEADDPALHGAAEVLLAVAHVDEVAVDHGRAVDGLGAHLVAPDHLAGADFESVDAPARATGNQQALASYDGDDRAGVIGPP